LHLQNTGYQLSLDLAGFRGLDVDSVNSSSSYFAYLCIPACETSLHQKRMSIADRSHLRRQTVGTKKALITVVLWGLSFSNRVAVLALDFDTPVC
jgi:hypothetical protein